MFKLKRFLEDIFTDKKLEEVTLEKERIEDNVLNVLFEIREQLDRIEGSQNDRNSKRGVNGDEIKRTLRRETKKVRSNKRTTNRVYNEI